MSQENYDEQFMRQLSSSYGQMETVLGADGYKVFMEDHCADQERTRADADRRKATAAAIRVISFMVFMASIPVVVFLWKWALSA